MYKLDFYEDAWDEWSKLDFAIKEQLYKKIKKVLVMPHIKANKLRDLKGCYKIKLKSSGYRVVYRVLDDVVVIEIVSVGKRKRERNEAYKAAAKRL
ncbi:TPA: type II toxin-antitoxin system RelE/ParE family toxin [Escherichia coli]